MGNEERDRCLEVVKFLTTLSYCVLLAVLLLDMYVVCVELDQLGAYVTLLIPIVVVTPLELIPLKFLGKITWN